MAKDRRNITVSDAIFEKLLKIKEKIRKKQGYYATWNQVLSKLLGGE